MICYFCDHKIDEMCLAEPMPFGKVRFAHFNCMSPFLNPEKLVKSDKKPDITQPVDYVKDKS